MWLTTSQILLHYLPSLAWLSPRVKQHYFHVGAIDRSRFIRRILRQGLLQEDNRDGYRNSWSIKGAIKQK